MTALVSGHPFRERKIVHVGAPRTTFLSLNPNYEVNLMPELDNEPYLGYIAQVEAEMPPPVPESVINAVRSELLRDYRSLPSDHPFYSEGAALENSIAAELAFLYGATTNDAPPPDAFGELMTEQPTKTMNF
jgi:hypothetical protein